MHYGALTELNSHLAGSPIDAFICCASFEERSKVAAECLEGSLVRHAWIAYNQDFESHTRRNLEAIRSRFGDRRTLIKIDTSDPLLTADRIKDRLSTVLADGPPKRIVVDITSFTRESLLILVNILMKQSHRQNTLEFLYTYAKEYSVGDETEAKWLSKGNREIRSVLGYSGDLVPSRPNHLIVLLGFEDERALSLIYECNPARISLGIADENDWATAPHQEKNLSCLRRLQSVMDTVEDFTFSGYDAKATKVRIQEVIARTPEYNAIVAPMNTKISTLGAAVAALEDPSIQVCYARATIYNVANYSNAGNQFFHTSLSEISETLGHLDS